MSRYDDLREHLGHALSMYMLCQRGLVKDNEVHKAILDACEEVNKLEFGVEGERSPIYHPQPETTSTEGDAQMSFLTQTS